MFHTSGDMRRPAPAVGGCPDVGRVAADVGLVIQSSHEDGHVQFDDLDVDDGLGCQREEHVRQHGTPTGVWGKS